MFILQKILTMHLFECPDFWENPHRMFTSLIHCLQKLFEEYNNLMESKNIEP